MESFLFAFMFFSLSQSLAINIKITPILKSLHLLLLFFSMSATLISKDQAKSTLNIENPLAILLLLSHSR